jgi:AcrR family transcriptional regulator
VAANQEAQFHFGRCTLMVDDASRESVNGLLERAIGEEGFEASGSGALVDFAEFLAMNACRRLADAVAADQVIHSSINVFAAATARVLSGECRIAKISDQLASSTTEIRDDEVGLVAIVSQTIALSAPSRTTMAVEDKVVALDRAANGKVAKLAALDIPAVRRRQIFDAALKVITTKGFERSTIREITREAGLTIPTMYQYFKRKDDILELIFDTYIQKMETDLKAAIVSHETAKEKLTAAVRVTLASLHNYHREILIMAQETKSLRPDVKKTVVRKMLRYLSNFVEIIALGVQTGEFRKVEPELYANLIPMMCQVWTQRYWSVGKFGLEALETAVLDLTIRGLEK